MADDDKPTSGITGFIGQIFSFVDAPWKAMVVVLFFVVGGLGWTFYQYREQIIEAWITPSAPQLKIAEVKPALGRLMEETSADIVQIWKVDLANNAQRFIASRRRDSGERVITSTTSHRLPVITTRSDATRLVTMLAGNSACVGVTDQIGPWGPLGKHFIANGITRLCAIPIPAGPESFIGVIYLAWIQPPESSVEDVAISAAREIAGELATH